MRFGVLVVPALALLLSASDAAGQELKKVTGPPVVNTAEEEQPKVGGAVSKPALLKPHTTTLGGSDKPMGAPPKPTLRAAPGSGPEMGLDTSAAGGLGAKKKKHRPKIRFSCEKTSCIDRVRVVPEGNRVNFAVLTTSPAKVLITLGLMKPQKREFARVEKTIWTNVFRIESKTHVTGLAPDRTYYYVAKAKGEDGLFHYAEGQFSTTGRKVDVVIENIHVSNDGDDVGPGDFTFTFDVMGHVYTLTTQIHSGSNKAVNKTISVGAVPPNLRIDLAVDEDDTSPGMVKKRAQEQHYSGIYNVESTDEKVTQNFSLNAANGEYALVVTGKLHISYE
jgi:hypothetical protein